MKSVKLKAPQNIMISKFYNILQVLCYEIECKFNFLQYVLINRSAHLNEFCPQEIHPSHVLYVIIRQMSSPPDLKINNITSKWHKVLIENTLPHYTKHLYMLQLRMSTWKQLCEGQPDDCLRLSVTAQTALLTFKYLCGFLLLTVS